MKDSPKTQASPVPATGAPRWMKVLLAVSLAINLGVLGLVGGAALRGAGDRGWPDVREIGFGPFSDALSPQDRQELRRAFLQDGGNPREMRRVMRSEEIDPEAVQAIISMSAEPTLDGIVRKDADGAPEVMIRTRKKTIVPRSPTQIRYMERLAQDDLIFALGPAGTGKTYLAVAQAVQQLIAGSVDRLILSRPAVEAGERLGFLPEIGRASCRERVSSPV